MGTGLRRRLHNLSNRGRDGPLVFCPVDDSLLAGPFGGLQNMRRLIDSICSAEPSAVLAFRGTLEQYADELKDTPTILNCMASVVGPYHVEKVIVHEIKEAVSVGADGVAGHINLFSEFTNHQISHFSTVSRVAHEFGMPVVAIAYPRRTINGADDNFDDLKAQDPEQYARLVAHAVRVAVELGADIIKTQFTGNKDTFHLVVDAACGIPLLIAGGPKLPKEQALGLARDAVAAGANGVSFGRNIFNRSNPGEFIGRLKSEI